MLMKKVKLPLLRKLLGFEEMQLPNGCSGTVESAQNHLNGTDETNGRSVSPVIPVECAEVTVETILVSCSEHEADKGDKLANVHGKNEESLPKLNVQREVVIVTNPSFCCEDGVSGNKTESKVNSINGEGMSSEVTLRSDQDDENNNLDSKESEQLSELNNAEENGHMQFVLQLNSLANAEDQNDSFISQTNQSVDADDNVSVIVIDDDDSVILVCDEDLHPDNNNPDQCVTLIEGDTVEYSEGCFSYTTDQQVEGEYYTADTGIAQSNCMERDILNNCMQVSSYEQFHADETLNSTELPQYERDVNPDPLIYHSPMFEPSGNQSYTIENGTPTTDDRQQIYIVCNKYEDISPPPTPTCDTVSETFEGSLVSSSFPVRMLDMGRNIMWSCSESEVLNIDNISTSETENSVQDDTTEHKLVIDLRSEYDSKDYELHGTLSDYCAFSETDLHRYQENVSVENAQDNAREKSVICCAKNVSVTRTVVEDDVKGSENRNCDDVDYTVSVQRDNVTAGRCLRRRSFKTDIAKLSYRLQRACSLTVDHCMKILESFYDVDAYGLQNSIMQLSRYIDFTSVPKSMKLQLLMSMYLFRMNGRRNAVNYLLRLLARCLKQRNRKHSILASLQKCTKPKLHLNGFVKPTHCSAVKVRSSHPEKSGSIYLGNKKIILPQQSETADFYFSRDVKTEVREELTASISIEMATHLTSSPGVCVQKSVLCNSEEKSPLLPKIKEINDSSNLLHSKVTSVFACNKSSCLNSHTSTLEKSVNYFDELSSSPTEPGRNFIMTPKGSILSSDATHCPMPIVNGKFPSTYPLDRTDLYNSSPNPEALHCQACIFQQQAWNFAEPYSAGFTQGLRTHYDHCPEQYMCHEDFTERTFSKCVNSESYNSACYYSKNSLYRNDMIDRNFNMYDKYENSVIIKCKLCAKSYRSTKSAYQRLICYDCEYNLKKYNMTLEEYIDLLNEQDLALIKGIEYSLKLQAMQEKYGNLPPKKRLKSWIQHSFEQMKEETRERRKSDSNLSNSDPIENASYPAVPMMSIASLPNSSRKSLVTRRFSCDDRRSVSSLDSSCSERIMSDLEYPASSAFHLYDRISPSGHSSVCDRISPSGYSSVYNDNCGTQEHEPVSDNENNSFCLPLNVNVSEKSNVDFLTSDESEIQTQMNHHTDNNETNTDRLPETVSCLEQDSNSCSKDNQEAILYPQRNHRRKRRGRKSHTKHHHGTHSHKRKRGV